MANFTETTSCSEAANQAQIGRPWAEASYAFDYEHMPRPRRKSQKCTENYMNPIYICLLFFYGRNVN
jgi:hypothetical protein